MIIKWSFDEVVRTVGGDDDIALVVKLGKKDIKKFGRIRNKVIREVRKVIRAKLY